MSYSFPGHEIASHSETHNPSHSFWKYSKYDALKKEIVGYHDKLKKAGNIVVCLTY